MIDGGVTRKSWHSDAYLFRQNAGGRRARRRFAALDRAEGVARAKVNRLRSASGLSVEMGTQEAGDCRDGRASLRDGGKGMPHVNHRGPHFERGINASG
jgi:hypothetical protein